MRVQRGDNHWVRGRMKHIPLSGSSPFAFPAKGKQLASAKRRQLGNAKDESLESARGKQPGRAKGEQAGSAKGRQLVEKQEILSQKEVNYSACIKSFFF